MQSGLPGIEPRADGILALMRAAALHGALGYRTWSQMPESLPPGHVDMPV